jgi:hypothetical protein
MHDLRIIMIWNPHATTSTFLPPEPKYRSSLKATFNINNILAETV